MPVWRMPVWRMPVWPVANETTPGGVDDFKALKLVWNSGFSSALPVRLAVAAFSTAC
jgi:hypothetical protein